jgi:hypothetical protein
MAMDYTRSSVISLVRGPLFFTPQGWVVLLTLVACWSWAAVVWSTGNGWPFGDDVERALAMLLAWPFLVLLFYVRLCLPHFLASWNNTALLAISALGLPLLLIVGVL